MDLNDKECAICPLPGTKCTNCFKIRYCSPEHQQTHRAEHKQFCYPATLKLSERNGVVMVATRNMLQGELFYKETAVIHGPSGLRSGREEFVKLCLGCYNPVRSDPPYACTACAWPVCSAKCEKKAPHLKFECLIFGKNQVPPFTRQEDYEFITVLRCLILRDTNPGRWDKLMALDSRSEERERLRRRNRYKPAAAKGPQTESVDLMDRLVNFIQNTCKLAQYNRKTIDYVYGVVQFNAFGENDVPGFRALKKRWGSFIFESSSLFPNSCFPNTRWSISEKWTPDGKPTYTISWRTTLAIRKDEMVATNFTDLTKGSFQRREDLLEGYNFSCKCARCSDPTELGTFFSAMKCEDCEYGYYLPLATPGPYTIWACGDPGCNGSTTASHVQLLVELIEDQLNLLGPLNPEQGLSGLQEFLNKHQGKTVHRNHYLMMEAELLFIRQLFRVVPTLSNDAAMYWIPKLVTLCDHSVYVFSRLLPGLSLKRGFLLFYLANAKYIQLTKETGRVNSRELARRQHEIGMIVAEAWSILAQEPEGSEARYLANASPLFDALRNQSQRQMRLFSHSSVDPSV